MQARGVETVLPFILCFALITSVRANDSILEACMVPATSETGDDVFEGHLAALRIEARKSEPGWQWMPATSRADCRPEQPILILEVDGEATLMMPGGDSQTFDLEDVAPDTRFREMARAVMNHLGRGQDSDSRATVPLLNENDDIALGGPLDTTADTEVGKTSDHDWVTRIHGAYVYQFQVDRHLGGPVLEVGAAFHEGRLVLGLSGGYFMGAEAELGGVSVGLDCVEILAMGRLGFGSGPLFTRIGLGGGWQRQNVTANSTGRQAGDVRAISDVAVLALDFEGQWSLGEQWHLGITVGPRAYLGGVEHLWLGQRVYGDVPGAMAAQLGLGYAL